MNRFMNLMAIFATFAPDDGKGGGEGGGKGGGGDDDVEARILRMVNAAVTSQLGRKLESSITTALAPILEKLEATSKPDPADDKKKDGEVSPQLAALQAQVTGLTSQLAEKDATGKANDKKHREEQLVAQIREGLTQSGVKKELMEGAVATVRGKMKIDPETGAVTYAKQNVGWTEPLSVEAGLKDWTESDTGKAHLPPLPGGGGGTTPPNGGRSVSINPASLPTDPKARAKVIKDHKISEARKDLRKHAGDLIGGGRIQIAASVPEGSEG